MAEETGIQWCDHTFNPWRGCTKVAAGCVNCYADAQSKRNPAVLGIWGPNGKRVVAAEHYWQQPLKWNQRVGCRRCSECEGLEHHWIEDWDPSAESDHSCEHCRAIADGCLECCNGYAFAASDDHAWDHVGGVTDQPCAACDGNGVTNVRIPRPRVFCASLADVFEDWRGPLHLPSGELAKTFNGEWDAERTGDLTIDDVRRRLFKLIDATPNLDWLLVTKRPENIRRMWPALWKSHPMPNCRGQYDRMRVPRRKNVWLLASVAEQGDVYRNVPHLLECRDLCSVIGLSAEPLIDSIDIPEEFLMPNYAADDPRHTERWMIAGGESGSQARPCDVDWIRRIKHQCEAAGVPVFVKQLGRTCWMDRSDAVQPVGLGGGWDATSRGSQRGLVTMPHHKGGDPEEWPEDLRVRQFPDVSHEVLSGDANEAF